MKTSEKTDTGKKNKKKLNTVWIFSKDKNKRQAKRKKKFCHLLCLRWMSPPWASVKKNASRLKHRKIQCLWFPPLSSCLSSSLSPLPLYPREVNDAAVRLESRLFDLDSKPAFLNKYSVAGVGGGAVTVPALASPYNKLCMKQMLAPIQHHYSLWRGAYRKSCCINLLGPRQQVKYI